MRKKFNFFLKGILMLILVAAVWASYLYHKPHENASGLHADYSLHAADLYQDYAMDELRADKKYLNKIIIVQGKISEITVNGKTQIILLDKKITGGVSCQMGQSIGISGNSIPQDSIIQIKGRCTGYLMDVNLVDCVMQ